MIFSIAKYIHLIIIILSISGFILRSYFLLAGSSTRWFSSLPKKLPHYIDSLLLASALVMIWQWQINPIYTPWLAEKLVALCVYVFLGMIALHWARSKRAVFIASSLAIICFFYIIYVAVTKTTLIF